MSLAERLVGCERIVDLIGGRTPVTGRVVETAEVKMMAGGTVAAIIAAGIVDGFNPCAFSIIIGLAGVLAVGSHTRRARMLAGWGG